MNNHDKYYHISCSLDIDDSIECVEENGKKINTALEKINNDLILTYSPGDNVFKYSIEIRSNTLFRVVCNGETFSEFTWGNERYTRWATKHYVNRLTCLLSKNINILRINNNVLVGFNNTFNYNILYKEISILDEWKIISNFNVYNMYTVIYDLDIPLDKISPPLLPGKKVKDFVQKLVESSIFLSTLKTNKYLDLFSNILSNAIVYKKYPYVILAYMAFRENALNKITLDNKSCIEYNEENGYVVIGNKCTDRLRLFIIGSNGFLSIVLDKDKRYKISRKLFGLIERIISWRLA